MTVATRRKAQEKPAFLPVGDPFVSHGFPCKIERDCDGGPTPFLMTVDSQVIGYARTETDALVTIDTYCDELAKLTKADTADMEAGKAENKTLGTCEHCHTAPATHQVGGRSATALWLCDACGELAETDKVIKALATAAHLAADIPGTDPRICRMNPTGSHWTICGAPGDEPCMCSAIISTDFEAIRTQEFYEDEWEYDQEKQAAAIEELRRIAAPHFDGVDAVQYVSDLRDCPAHPAGEGRQNRHEVGTSVLDELRANLDHAITVRLATTRGTAEWDAAQQQVMVCADALKAFHLPTLEAMKADTKVCPSCGDPSQGVCPACRESGERPARATDLEPIDAVFAPPFGLPRPAPTEDDPSEEETGRCEGYQGNDCLNRAVATREINLSTNPAAPYDVRTFRLCSLCSTAWDAWLAAKPCLACGQAHGTQRCSGVLSLLLDDSDTVEAEGLALTKGFCRDQGYTPEPVPAWLYGAGTGGNPVITFSKPVDDPCAGVRRERDAYRAALECLANAVEAERAADRAWWKAGDDPNSEEAKTAREAAGAASKALDERLSDARATLKKGN